MGTFPRAYNLCNHHSSSYDNWTLLLRSQRCFTVGLAETVQSQDPFPDTKGSEPKRLRTEITMANGEMKQLFAMRVMFVLKIGLDMSCK